MQPDMILCKPIDAAFCRFKENMAGCLEKMPGGRRMSQWKLYALLFFKLILYLWQTMIIFKQDKSARQFNWMHKSENSAQIEKDGFKNNVEVVSE